MSWICDVNPFFSHHSRRYGRHALGSTPLLVALVAVSSVSLALLTMHSPFFCFPFSRYCCGLFAGASVTGWFGIVR